MGLRTQQKALNTEEQSPLLSSPWSTTPHCSETITTSSTRILESHKDPKMCSGHYMTM